MSTEQEQAQTERKERIQWAANCRHVLTYTAKRDEMAKIKLESKRMKRLVDSQAQKIAEQAKEIETAKSLAGIATKRFFEAKQSAEKYRNAYVYANARRDGHHPQSMLHAEVLPWERWEAETKRLLDLTDLEREP